MPALHRPAIALLAAAWLGAGAPAALAAPSPAPAARSSLDRELFFQILVGEMQLRADNPGAAYQLLLEAARRTRDEGLFKRVTEIAFEARAGDQALAAARAWRQALPKSQDALRHEVQVLSALNRMADTAEPLGQLISLLPAAERPAALRGLPASLARAGEPAAVLAVVEKVVLPYLKSGAWPEAAAASWLALGRARLAAGQGEAALAAVREAQRLSPRDEAAALLALELMAGQPEAEQALRAFLDAQPPAPAPVFNALRLAYARALAAQQRHGDALPWLERVTREAPDQLEAWLALGALKLELRRPAEAEQALRSYLERLDAAEARGAVEEPGAGPAGLQDEAPLQRQRRSQALLMLAQAAEQQGDLEGAERWLARVEGAPPLMLASRLAALQAQRGRVDEARRLLAEVPASSPEEARAKLLAEAQLLRDLRRWDEAAALLERAQELFPRDVDVLYERAMVEEKRGRFDTMETLLRQIIGLQPDHHHAYNALGYTLADRGQRLPEALGLIRKALELAPGEPFLLDSLGWVEYRMGHLDEAARWLRQAYRARPDPEIGAHLGEVLWVAGRHEEAREIWRQVRQRDADNAVLREALDRLKVGL